jgi:hypothetical protein
VSGAEDGLSSLRNPSLRRVAMGFADQIGQESDLIALPILLCPLHGIALLERYRAERRRRNSAHRGRLVGRGDGQVETAVVEKRSCQPALVKTGPA